MKVSDSQRVAQGAAVASARVSGADVKPADASREASDKVSLSAGGQAAEAVGRVRSGRSSRVDAIAAAVESGEYQVDASRVARRIVEDAELTARLRALLG